jgi:uncharacterized protein YjbI with pentapeptide repeats
LVKTILQEAKLQEAKLFKADLREANLQGADIDKTNLLKVDLRGADLRKVKNLTWERLAQAIRDENTEFPDYLQTPAPDKTEGK